MEDQKKQIKPEIKTESKKDKTITNRFIDFLFSNDERKWLLFIFLLGVILRFLIAKNISLLGDEAVHGPHTIGFLNSGLISTVVQSPLWFALTDVFMKVLGVTVFSVRFLSFFYGALSILLVYLIAKKVFNAKVGLISAFLLAVSSFTIRFTLMEMDLSCLFFLLFAVYAFILAMENKRFPWLAAICIGLAALIKTLSLFFVPAFIIGFFLFTKKDDSKTKKQHITKIIINIIFFGLIIVAVFSPILVHNYLWCQDKGMIDVYFAKYFKDFKIATGFPQCLDITKINSAYGMQQGYETSFEGASLFQGIINNGSDLISRDTIIMILGFLGLILMFSLKEKRKYLWFFLSFNIFGFLLLVLTDRLSTHFTTMIPLFCIFGGIFIDRASADFAKKIKIEPKRILTAVILIILLFQLYLLWPHLSSECATSQMRDYAISSLDKNSVIITDSRIYTGRVALMFNDFHYLDAALFSQLMQVNQNSSGQIPVKVYYLECASDDCGWGTMKDNPSLNQSMEGFTDSFSNIPVLKTILGGGGYDEATGMPYYRVYQAAINLNPELIPMIDSTHNWWYYPINYKPKSQIFDSYNVNGAFNNVIYKFEQLISWMAILLAILLALAPFYYLSKNKN